MNTSIKVLGRPWNIAEVVARELEDAETLWGWLPCLVSVTLSIFRKSIKTLLLSPCNIFGIWYGVMWFDWFWVNSWYQIDWANVISYVNGKSWKTCSVFFQGFQWYYDCMQIEIWNQMRSDEGSHLDEYKRDGGSRQVEAPPTENHRRIVKAGSEMLMLRLMLIIPCNPQHIIHWNPPHHHCSSNHQNFPFQFWIFYCSI